MDPISIAIEATICILGLAYFTLIGLMIKNRNKIGKDKIFEFYHSKPAYLFGINWLLAPELYNEKGLRYRKILFVMLIAGFTLIVGLIIADVINTK